jgi:D-inositol-3-phosphate glycosyltransferase
MRIAVVEPAAHGGLLHYHVQLGEALAARGHEVDLVTARGNELVDRVAHARMRAVLTPPATSDAAGAGGAYALRRAAVGARLTWAWLRILWETRPRRYDAVLIGSDIGLPPAAAATLFMTVVPGRPTLVRIAHNVRSFNRWSGDDVYSSSSTMDRLMSRLYRRFDLVIVHGDKSREEFEANWPGVPTAVVPHGDERIFGDDPPPPSDDERILFFGDWRKVKGLPVLMDAFDELVQRRPTARLTVAGTPSEPDWDPDILREWARGHDGRVEVIDRYVPIEDVPAVFARARVVATPYVTGYQSGVIHLAMTMGRAVVTSDVGDLGTAVVDGVTGRVVPPRDPAALADALEEVLADPDLASRFGAEGRRQGLSRSSWEHVAERVEHELLAVSG